MTVRRLGIAAALALPAGTAAVLALDAVWVAQGVPAAIRHRRSR